MMENKNYSYSEFYFDSTVKGQKIFTRLYEPAGEKRAILQIVHGMAEHTGLYHDFCAFLAENGIVAVLDDHLGHGKSVSSGEDYGYFFGEIENLLQDEKKLAGIVTGKYPELPFFMMGHSMGSFIVREYISRYPDKAKAAVIMGTSAGLSKAVWNAEKPILNSIIAKNGEKHKSKFIYDLAMKSYRKAHPEDCNAWITSLESEKERYTKDPLCGFPLTVSAFRSMGELLNKINDKKWYESVPRKIGLLLISGGQDPVGGMGKGVEKIYKKLVYSCHRVKLIIYPELRHALVNEKESEKTYGDILFFLENEINRCKKPKKAA